MDEFQELLPWFNSTQAISFWQSITGKQITIEALLAGHFPLYVDCSSLKGDEYEGACRPVRGDGIQRIERLERMAENPFYFGELRAVRPIVSGSVWIYASGDMTPDHKENVLWRVGSVSTAGQDRSYELPVLINSADIQVLIEKMFGYESPQAREAALFRAVQVNLQLDAITEQLAQAHRVAEALEQRAAKSESKAAEYKAAWKSALSAEGQVRQQLDLVSVARNESERRASYADAAAAELKDQRRQLAQERTYLEAARAEIDNLHQALKSKKEQPSQLLAIAGLLELLLDDSRPRYNQGTAADAIEGQHPDWYGASASKLTKLFADAKSAAKDADKVAQARAEGREAAATRTGARKVAKV